MPLSTPSRQLREPCRYAHRRHLLDLRAASLSAVREAAICETRDRRPSNLRLRGAVRAKALVKGRLVLLVVVLRGDVRLQLLALGCGAKRLRAARQRVSACEPLRCEKMCMRA